MIKKSRQEKREYKSKKGLALPTSFLVIYSLILLVLVFLVCFFAPYAFGALRELVYYEFREYSPYIYIIVFLLAFIMLITVLGFMLLQNEKIKKRNELKQNNYITNYSSFDSERSYLESKISELSNQLQSSQKRWEEVNHLLLSSQERNLKKDGKISPNEFLLSFGIEMDKVCIQDNLVFLLTSFHENNYNEYFALKSACKKLDYEMIRGDEEYITGDMLAFIIGCIAKAKIVIANINGRNPNVFYELGITHMMGKPTILICHETNKIPFDLQNRYVIMYKDELDLQKRIEKVLGQLEEKETAIDSKDDKTI